MGRGGGGVKRLNEVRSTDLDPEVANLPSKSVETAQIPAESALPEIAKTAKESSEVSVGLAVVHSVDHDPAIANLSSESVETAQISAESALTETEETAKESSEVSVLEKSQETFHAFFAHGTTVHKHCKSYSYLKNDKLVVFAWSGAFVAFHPTEDDWNGERGGYPLLG
jgi:hypothetical protein